MFLDSGEHTFFFFYSAGSLSTAKLATGQQKHLLFEVQPGSDSTALWKVAVRVLCTKVKLNNLFSICLFVS